MSGSTVVAPSSVSVWTALRLLAGVRVRRTLNALGVTFRGGRRKKKDGAPREGTARQKPLGPVLVGAILLAMLAIATSQSSMAVMALRAGVDHPSEVASNAATSTSTALAPASRRPPLALPEGPLSPALLRGLTITLGVLMLIALSAELGSSDISAADWDMEWLITMPLATGTLLWARVSERTLASTIAWLALWPLGMVVAWTQGHGLWAPLTGLLLVLPLLLLLALVRTLLDVGLRCRMAPARLRNLAALASLAVWPLMYMVLPVGDVQAGRYLPARLAQHLPDAVLWTPPGLLLQAFNGGAVAAVMGYIGLALLEVALLVTLGMAWLRHELRQGLVAGGARESARGDTGRPHRWANSWGWMHPIQWREFVLLARDRNFLVQTLLLPIVVVASQFYWNPAWGEGLGSDPVRIAAVAFGLACYMLLMSSFRTLANEGQALWLFYTFPANFRRTLWQKAWLWGLVALVYPLAVYGAIIAAGTPVTVELVAYGLLVLLGVPIFSIIGQALGVYAYDPTAPTKSQQLRPAMSYLYFLVVALYVGGMYAPHWWQTAEMAFLTLLLAAAIWQKVEQRLPYLLDETAIPPSRLASADGIVAVMMFFVAQVLSMVVLERLHLWSLEARMGVSFALAGLVVFALVRYASWRNRSQGVPVYLKGATPGLWLWVLAGSAVAIPVGLGYLHVIRVWDLMPVPETAATPAPGAFWWLGGVVVVAAPIFEEFIFRGLVYGGMRQHATPVVACVASAALFALVHPPLSFIPVFVLGLCTAWAYERTRVLAAPVLVHALYNLAVLSAQ